MVVVMDVITAAIMKFADVTGVVRVGVWLKLKKMCLFTFSFWFNEEIYGDIKLSLLFFFL